MSHSNARTTVFARRLIVERHRAGWAQARIAEQLGVSGATVSKWISRYRAEGEHGLQDRCSRPRTTPTRTDPAVEAHVLALREQERRGAVRCTWPVSSGWSSPHQVVPPGRFGDAVPPVLAATAPSRRRWPQTDRRRSR